MLLIGDSIPSEWLMERDSIPEMAVIWQFRTRDCLSCTFADDQVRRVQARFDGAIPFIAVQVGAPADSTVARGFFAARRLSPRLITISPKEHANRFGGANLPNLTVVHSGKVVWTTADQKSMTTEDVSLDSLIQLLRVPLLSGNELGQSLSEYRIIN